MKTTRIKPLLEAALAGDTDALAEFLRRVHEDPKQTAIDVARLARRKRRTR
jgi:hypothetical protein